MIKIREVGEYILENIKEHLSVYIFAIFLLISVIVIFLKKYSSDVSATSQSASSLSPQIDVKSFEQTNVKVTKDIVVDLSGAVLNPGVYTIPEGSRIYEIIKKGGGVSNAASLAWVAKNINLSKKLSDSEKIYVPFDWELEKDEDINLLSLDQTEDGVIPPVLSSSGVVVNSKINVNKAGTAELDTLAGIGAVYVQKIIDNRPYKNITDFYANSGIPKSTVDKIKDLIGF